MKSLFPFLLVICPGLCSLAQSPATETQTHQWLSAGISSMAYKGDLGENFSKWSGGLKAGLQFNTHKKLSGSLNVLVGSATGQDTSPAFHSDGEENRIPNTFFKTSVASVYYQLLWNVYSGARLRVFVGQGAGLLRYSPKTDDGTSLASQNNTRAANETYGTLSVLAPTSIGMAWKFKNRFGVSYRLTLYNTVTDYLDNISQLGTKAGGDNLLGQQLSLLIPVKL